MNLVYMKTKIYLGILSLALGLSLASCSEDDDYTIHTTPILNESSVVTGMPEAIRPASSMVLRKTTCPRTCRLLMTAAPSVLS